MSAQSSGSGRLSRTEREQYATNGFVVREAVFSQVVRRLAGPGTGLTRRHLSALEALVTEGHEGAQSALPGGIQVLVGRGRICFETTRARGRAGGS